MRVVMPNIKATMDSQPGDAIRQLAPRPRSLDGKVVGFLDGWGHRQADGSHGMYPLMTEILRFLRSEFELKDYVWCKKPSVSEPLPEDRLKEFLGQVDVVVNGECA